MVVNCSTGLKIFENKFDFSKRKNNFAITYLKKKKFSKEKKNVCIKTLAMKNHSKFSCLSILNLCQVKIS